VIFGGVLVLIVPLIDPIVTLLSDVVLILLGGVGGGVRSSSSISNSLAASE